MISCRDLVPERQLRVCRDMTCGADYLQVADKAAPNITEAGMIDSGGYRPDAAGMVPDLALAAGIQVTLFGGERTAEAIERDDSFDQKAFSRNLC